MHVKIIVSRIQQAHPQLQLKSWLNHSLLFRAYFAVAGKNKRLSIIRFRQIFPQERKSKATYYLQTGRLQGWQVTYFCLLFVRHSVVYFVFYSNNCKISCYFSIDKLNEFSYVRDHKVSRSHPYCLVIFLCSSIV